MTSKARPAGQGDCMNNETKHKLRRILKRIGLRMMVLRALGLGRVSGMQQLLPPLPNTPLLTSPVNFEFLSRYPLKVVNELGEPPLETPLWTPMIPPHTASSASSERTYPPSPTSSVPTTVTDLSVGADSGKEPTSGGVSAPAAALMEVISMPVVTSEPDPMPHTLVPGRRPPRPVTSPSSEKHVRPSHSFQSATPRLSPIAYQPAFDPYNESFSSDPVVRQQYLVPSGHQRFSKDTTPITPDFCNDVLVASPDIDAVGRPENVSRPRPPPAPRSTSVVRPFSSPPELNPIPYIGPFDPYADETFAPPPVPERSPARLSRPYSVDTPVTPEFSSPPQRQIGETSSVSTQILTRYSTNGELCYTPGPSSESFHTNSSSEVELIITAPVPSDNEGTSCSQKSRFANHQRLTNANIAEYHDQTSCPGLTPALQCDSNMILLEQKQQQLESKERSSAQPPMSALEIYPGPVSINNTQGDYDYMRHRASKTQSDEEQEYGIKEVHVRRGRESRQISPCTVLDRSESGRGVRQQSHGNQSSPFSRPAHHQVSPPRRLDSTQQHLEVRSQRAQGPNQRHGYEKRPQPGRPDTFRRLVTDPQAVIDVLDDEFARNPPHDTVPNPNLSLFDFIPRSPENSSEGESHSHASSIKLRKKILVRWGKHVMTFLNGEGRKKF